MTTTKPRWVWWRAAGHGALCILVAALVLSPRAVAAEPVVPRLEGQVTDLAELLSPAEEEALLQRLRPLEAETGAQVAVLTVPNLGGEPIESFAIAVARDWALGQEDRDNGLLIVVAKEERELRIEVGRGLEGAVTDLTSKRIIDERMVPRFRDGDFGGGILAAVETLDPIIRGEPMPALPEEAGATAGAIIFLTLFFLVMAVLGLAAMAVGGTFAATIYLVVLPFSYLVPTVTGSEALAWSSFALWAAGFPFLYVTWGRALRAGGSGKRGWHRPESGDRYRRGGLGGWTIHSGGSGGSSGSSGGGWSGGGGGFGGGGASGGW